MPRISFWFVAFALLTGLLMFMDAIGSGQVTGNGNNRTTVTGNGFFAPTPTPAPTGCGTIPTLTPGQPYSASFAPYCNGPWTQRVQANCLSSGTCVASWSQSEVNAEFNNGNSCEDCVIQVSGGPDGRGGVAYADGPYYAKAGDPTINVSCGGPWCDNVDNGGMPNQSGPRTSLSFTMQIPAVARVPGGFCDGGDHSFSVIQLNGDELDVAYAGCFGSAGSGPNGNWQNGDHMTVGAAANCGNFATGSGAGWVQNTVVSAAGACLAAGHLRANEIASGIVTHALRNITECTGNTGGAAAMFPAGNFARGNAGPTCAGGSGPPLGAHLWWDETRAIMVSHGLSDQTWLFIFDSLFQMGMYNSDNVGSKPYGGFGEIVGDGGVQFSQYASPQGSTNNNPYRNLSNWSVSGSENPGELDFGISHNQPNIFAGHVGSGDYLDPKVHMHFLNSCAATTAGC